MKKLIRHYANFWKEKIEIERNEEKSLHLQEIYNLGPKREKKYKAILNCKWKKIQDLDDICLIRFWRKENFQTEIKEQDIVVILPNFFYKFKDLGLKQFEKKLENMPLWTVHYVWKQFIDIWINKPFPDRILKSNVDIHLFVNDITFKRQEEALDLLPKLKSDKINFIVATWAKQNKISEYETDLEELKTIKLTVWEQTKVDFISSLNKNQQSFIQKSLDFSLFLLLHWPFGTGKTTTLVESILQNYKRWEKILVSADSNTAVDNILLRLVKFDFFKPGDIIRVWPYTRLAQAYAGYSIYELMENHSLSKKLRQLDIEIDKLKKQQDKYKKPVPSIRRWLSDDQIHRFAAMKKAFRGLKPKQLISMSNWLLIQNQINSVIEEKEKIKQIIQNEIIENAKIVLSTNSMCFSDFLKWERFDLVIIDEWSQATEPSCLLPIILWEKFIIAWDHKQLPPTVLSEKAEELRKSLFERLIEYIDNEKVSELKTLLEIQYRMNEKLMQFPNKMFYDWKLKADEKVKNITLKDLLGDKKTDIISTQECLYWLNIKWKQIKDSNTNSIYNLEEVKIVENLVKQLMDLGVDPVNIWIISPYSAQVSKLKDKIKNLEINTVDGFQWREKEIIIISWVRNENLGFLVDYRRLNVAITRAKRLLINVGNMANLKADKIFKEYESYIKNVWKFIEIN